jgi:hypothetical protein
MHHNVRELYKRFLIAGRNYPQGLSFVREKAKEAFFQNRDISDEFLLNKAIVKGRYWVREINAISMLHKYRSVRKRYSD